MVKTTEIWHFNDLASIGCVNITALRCVHLETEVGSAPMVIVEVVREDPFEVARVENDHVVHAIAADTTYDPLHVWILPRAAWLSIPKIGARKLETDFSGSFSLRSAVILQLRKFGPLTDALKKVSR